MDTTRDVNGQPTDRDHLKDITIADQRVLKIVERARRRGAPDRT